MTYAYKPEDFPIFTKPDSETLSSLGNKIPQFLHNVASILQIKSANEILVCSKTMLDM